MSVTSIIEINGVWYIDTSGEAGSDAVIIKRDGLLYLNTDKQGALRLFERDGVWYVDDITAARAGGGSSRRRRR